MWKPLIRLRKKFIIQPRIKRQKRQEVENMVIPPEEEIIKMRDDYKEQLLVAERNNETFVVEQIRGGLDVLNWFIQYGESKH